jgi:hypothetical protein
MVINFFGIELPSRSAETITLNTLKTVDHATIAASAVECFEIDAARDEEVGSR